MTQFTNDLIEAYANKFQLDGETNITVEKDHNGNYIISEQDLDLPACNPKELNISPEDYDENGELI